MTHKRSDVDRLLEVGALARVEGEGAMRVRVRDGEVTDVELQIYEPPRLFEALLRGRAATEAPDITARICGICPVAYQMSACLAVEDVCGVVVSEPIRLMRRLLYSGEWIESHALHIYLLHAPDFLGYQSAIDMARDHRDLVERGLRLKRAGNALMTTVGGRSVHPVNVRVGGFYRLPEPAELRTLLPDLEQAREDALETVRLASGFEFPDLEQPQEYVALEAGADYPIERGDVATSGGLRLPVREFLPLVEERQVPHSTALHAALAGRGPYAVGPLARYSLARGHLSPVAAQAAAEAGLGAVCRNPFRSILVRAVEVVHACDESIEIIRAWRGSDPPAVPVEMRAGTGVGATEAPRGALFHRYELDGDGIILDARIVPPTSQNQASIEADLRAFVQDRLDLPDEELTRECEQAIRNYDPCISCSAHFLDLRVERS